MSQGRGNKDRRDHRRRRKGPRSASSKEGKGAVHNRNDVEIEYMGNRTEGNRGMGVFNGMKRREEKVMVIECNKTGVRLASARELHLGKQKGKSRHDIVNEKKNCEPPTCVVVLKSRQGSH